MEYIDGQAILEKYGISLGELVKAILDGLPAYDAVTGKRVIDQDSMIARPKYETEEQAAKAVDLIDAGIASRRMSGGEKPFSTYAPGGASGVDGIVRRNKIRLFMETAKIYEFPAGQERPNEPCGIFPLRYDTFSREYSEPVILGMHGEGESIQGLYQKQIGAMRFPAEAVATRFGAAPAPKEQAPDGEGPAPQVSLAWRDVEVTILNDREIMILAGGRRTEYSFEDAGMSAHDSPSRPWKILILLGAHGGFLRRDAWEGAWSDLQTQVSRLRGKLGKLVPEAEGDPIPFINKKDFQGYKAEFRCQWPSRPLPNTARAREAVRRDKDED